MRVLAYEIPIMGNAQSNKSVTMRVELDERSNKGSIKLDAGHQLLRWQVDTKSLCYCCEYRRTLPGTWLYCAHSLGYRPSGQKKKCSGYKFSKNTSRKHVHPSN